MKTCYVSMPFGIKTDFSGLQVDFNRIYSEVLKPAVEGAGLACLRADELPTGALIHKAIFSAVLSSEVMIADITAANANVMYELGVRHAAQRGVTILLTSTHSVIPFDINYSKMIRYELDANGAVTGQAAQSLKQMVGLAIRAGLEHISIDSPLYEFFPDLRVELPEDLVSYESRRGLPARRSRTGRLGSSKDQRAAVKRVENEALRAADTDPIALINVMKAYRDISAWDEMIQLANAVPLPISKSSEVLQLIALALNRRAEPGDQDRAISTMEQLIGETGGDAETYGILGRIYKDRYMVKGRKEDLDAAIEYYRTSFERQSTDYYPGINVVTLLLQRKDAAAEQELTDILPKVREAVYNKMKDGIGSYWELATALQLACIAREWGEAEELARHAVEQSPSRWMLESTSLSAPLGTRLVHLLGSAHSSRKTWQSYISQAPSDAKCMIVAWSQHSIT